ncbi:MAG: hypothetical protein ACXVB9_01395 [Bdellovibrionota bacterium]
MRWVFIDQIVECEAGKSITAKKYFSKSEAFFADHLPGAPIVPGVLQIEMIVTAASLCMRALEPGVSLRLAIVKKAKFRKSINPDEMCVVKTELSRRNSGRLRATGSISVEGEMVAEAEVYMVIIPRKRGETPGPSNDVLVEWEKRRATSP